MKKKELIEELKKEMVTYDNKKDAEIVRDSIGGEVVVSPI